MIPSFILEPFWLQNVFILALRAPWRVTEGLTIAKKSYKCIMASWEALGDLVGFQMSLGFAFVFFAPCRYVPCLL